eukprot:1535387-Ditylum_brightwellii.AAC.1
MLLPSASPIFDKEASGTTDETSPSVVPPSQRGEALSIHDQGEPPTQSQSTLPKNKNNIGNQKIGNNKNHTFTLPTPPPHTFNTFQP